MSIDESLVAGALQPEDLEVEAGLRPRRMTDFIGQAPLKERLAIMIEAARGREEPLDHVLFSGPPGLGKTTLAGILATEMGARFRSTSGPALERPGDLAAVLSTLEESDVLFVDEVHRLSRVVEEVLYPAMEDREIDVMLGKGQGAASIKIPLPPFTLVGATTRVGRVAPPLRDRFGYVARLDYYETADLEAIVRRSAGILEVAVTPDGCHGIASRSRGTPRIANRLLRRVRDYNAVRSEGPVDGPTAREALAVFEVDHAGLDKVDRAILDSIVRKFGGGPVGLSTLAIAVSEEPETVEDAYEPFLLQQGFLQRTPRGRIATSLAYRHLGLEPPPQSAQPTLLDDEGG